MDRKTFTRLRLQIPQKRIDDLKDQANAWTAGDYAKDKDMTHELYEKQKTNQMFADTHELLEYLEKMLNNKKNYK